LKRPCQPQSGGLCGDVHESEALARHAGVVLEAHGHIQKVEVMIEAVTAQKSEHILLVDLPWLISDHHSHTELTVALAGGAGLAENVVR